ncbi:MAG TPA: hypothetical protein VLC92_21875 [Rhodocyclaceae bacterium]|nr:hypothetical protein [Rhodocyclaceae bacterium]
MTVLAAELLVELAATLLLAAREDVDERLVDVDEPAELVELDAPGMLEEEMLEEEMLEALLPLSEDALAEDDVEPDVEDVAWLDADREDVLLPEGGVVLGVVLSPPPPPQAASAAVMQIRPMKGRRERSA